MTHSAVQFSVNNSPPSSTLHQETDFEGIHEKICPLLKRLRGKVGFLGSEEERHARTKEERELRVGGVRCC